MAAVEEDDDGESPRATSHSAKRGLLSLRSTSRGSAVALGQSVSMRARVAPDSSPSLGDHHPARLSSLRRHRRPARARRFPCTA